MTVQIVRQSFEIGRGVRSKLDARSQGGGRSLDVDDQRGLRGLENWTIFMDVICV